MYDSNDVYNVPLSVVNFVNVLVFEGVYPPDKLPWQALCSYRVDYYLAQVNNGGHGQFVGNSGWKEETIVDIQTGLEVMGLTEALAIFEDLMLFASEEPERFVEAAEGGGFDDLDPIIKDLDDRFFARPSNQIIVGNDSWLRTKAPLEVLPDVECRARLADLVAANPRYEGRGPTQRPV